MYIYYQKKKLNEIRTIFSLLLFLRYIIQFYFTLSTQHIISLLIFYL